jgi:hypothetical protein
MLNKNLLLFLLVSFGEMQGQSKASQTVTSSFYAPYELIEYDYSVDAADSLHLIWSDELKAHVLIGDPEECLRYIVHALQVATRVDTLEPEQNDSVFSLTFSRKNMWRRGLLYQGAEPNDVAFLLYRTLQ